MTATEPTIAEQIEKWTPQQRLEALSKLAQVVMAGRKEPMLALGEVAPAYYLMERPKIAISTYKPDPNDLDMQDRLRRAKDPKNGIPVTPELLAQICEGID
jgi:hypothetical protein